MADAVPVRSGVRRAVTVAEESIQGCHAVVARFRSTARAGALSAEDGTTLAAAAELATTTLRPLVMVVASSGVDVSQGLPALHGWGIAARAVSRCSGIVPVVAVVAGPTVAGPALLLGMADVVVACDECIAYVSAPNMVERVTGVRPSPAELGGAGVLCTSGVATLAAVDLDDALDVVGDVLAHLPASCMHAPPRRRCTDPVERLVPELRELIPASPSGAYDVRAAIRAVADDRQLLEFSARWASNLVTALARIGGRPVGVIANQPSVVAGTLDVSASQKGAGFVEFCDSMNLPIVTMVDTPGYFPGKDLEWQGIIRHGAELVFAYAQASVPRICVVLRKAYGGAYIAMDCKAMGSDLCVGWPTAEVAVMGAKGAVAVLHRTAPAEEQAAREAEYEAMLTPWIAAERGFLDTVIDPADTRMVIGRALDMMASKLVGAEPRKHANGPL